jgi:hypothetical protein
MGCITAHQFVTIILPSLHSSLIVGRSEIDRPQGFGPRCKKARVVFPGRDTSEAYSSAFGNGNRQFCKLAFECLVAEDPKSKSKAANLGTNTLDCDSKVGETQHDDDNDDEDEDSDDETKEQKIAETKPSHECMPEFIRRLHQVLSFYETVSMVKAIPASNQSSSQSSSNGVDLQALTQPLEVTFYPSIFGRRANADRPLRPLAVFVEPLTKMNALEKLILSTFRIINPSYVEFYRRYSDFGTVSMDSPCPNLLCVFSGLLLKRQ